MKFSYDELLKIVFGKVYLSSWIESLEIVNDRELVVHHKHEFTNANLVALTWFPIRPAHYYANKDSGAATLMPPVGSGPYRVAEFGRGYIRYERVDDYWGRDIPVNRGRYNFDEITYDIYRDATVAREAFRKGLLDVYFEDDIGHWVSSNELPAVVDGQLIKDSRQVNKFIGMQAAIVLNLQRPRLQDVRVREALTLAMNFEWQNRVFHHSLRQRALSYFANSSFAATGLPSATELQILAPFRNQLPKRLFTHRFELPVSKATGAHRTGLKRAKTLLAEAGWMVRNESLVNADGAPFELELLTQNPSYRRFLLPYVESLKVLGIDVRLRLVDSLVAVNYLRDRNFDAYLRAHDFLNPPLGELQGYFTSQAADLETSGNLAGIRDPVVDALIEQAEHGGSLDTVMATCRALDRVLLWGFYHIPLNVPDDERFLFWDKFGRPAHESVAEYEYMVGSSVRLLDSWWTAADTRVVYGQ